MNLPNKNIRLFLAGLFGALLSIVIIMWEFKAEYLFVIGIAICSIILSLIVWFLLKYQSGDIDYKEYHNNALEIIKRYHSNENSLMKYFDSMNSLLNSDVEKN